MYLGWIGLALVTIHQQLLQQLSQIGHTNQVTVFVIAHTPWAAMIDLHSCRQPMSLGEINHPNISFVVVVHKKQ